LFKFYQLFCLENLSNNQTLNNNKNPGRLNYKNESNKNVSEDELIFRRSGKNGIIRNKKEREQLRGFNCEICEEVILKIKNKFIINSSMRILMKQKILI